MIGESVSKTLALLKWMILMKLDGFNWHFQCKEERDFHEDARSAQSKTTKNRCEYGLSENLSTLRLKVKCTIDGRRIEYKSGITMTDSNNRLGNKKIDALGLRQILIKKSITRIVR